VKQFPSPDRVGVLLESVDTQTQSVLDQLDCIEDDVYGVQSDIQQLRIGLTRLSSLRAKLEASR